MEPLPRFFSQYYLGNNQYPRSITTATDALSKHKIDPRYYLNQNRNGDNLRSNRKNRKTDNEVNPTIFSQQELTCYFCGKKGHTSNYFDKRSTTPRAKWACNKAMQHLQDVEGADTTDGNDVIKISADNRLVHSNTSNSSLNHRSGNINRRNQERNQDNNNPIPSWSQILQQP